MAFHNVPANGWPQIKDLEKLDALAKQIDNMPTFTSNDKAFLADLPAYPVTDGKKVLTATTDSGNTELSYGEIPAELPADPVSDGVKVLTATTESGETVLSWEEPGNESRTRNNITNNLSNLFSAIAEQDLTKYGYNIGDYYTGTSGYTYTLADIDTFYGGYNENAVVNTHHVAVVVNTHSNGKWNSTDSTSGGYTNSLLRTTLNGTVLTAIKSDFVALFGGETGEEHLLAHKMLLSTQSGYEWTTNPEFISALSEAQVYGENVWTSSGTSTGEAWKWLEVFRKYSFNLILGNIWFWLRNIVSGTAACNANGGGIAHNDNASHDGGIVGLIIIH